MSGSSSSAAQIAPGLILLAFIFLLMIRRLVLVTRGTRYSPTRIFLFAGYSVLVFALLGSTTIYLAWGAWGDRAAVLIGAYAAIIVVAALLFAGHVRGVVQFHRRPDGSAGYQLPMIVLLISLVLFGARIVAEVAVLGLGSVGTFSLPSSVSPTALAVLIAFDLLYGVSVGLVLGRGIGVHQAYRSWSSAERPLPSG